MTDYPDIRATLLALAGTQNRIVIDKAFVQFTGSLEAAILLSQLLYWTPRAGRPDGFIAKSSKEWASELFLSEYAIRKAREHLENMGILETKVMRWNGSPTLHYRIKMDELINRWNRWISQLDFAKSQNPNCENAESITDITSEITSNTTSSDAKNASEEDNYDSISRHENKPPESDRYEYIECDEDGMPLDDSHPRRKVKGSPPRSDDEKRFLEAVGALYWYPGTAIKGRAIVASYHRGLEMERQFGQARVYQMCLDEIMACPETHLSSPPSVIPSTWWTDRLENAKKYRWALMRKGAGRNGLIDNFLLRSSLLEHCKRQLNSLGVKGSATESSADGIIRIGDGKEHPPDGIIRLGC